MAVVTATYCFCFRDVNCVRQCTAHHFNGWQLNFKNIGYHDHLMRGTTSFGWEHDRTTGIFAGLTTSGLDGHITVSGPSMSNLFVGTFFEFGGVENCFSR